MVAFGLTAVIAGVLPSVLMGDPSALLLVVLRNAVLVALLATAWAAGSPAGSGSRSDDARLPGPTVPIA